MADDVKITCLCGQVQEVVRLQSQTPVEITLCHCNSCRSANGTLVAPSLPLAAPPKCVGGLRGYRRSANLHRYFCSTCGTNNCYHLNETDVWFLRSGVVERIAENEQVLGKLEEIIEHRFVEDTLDGGLASCLTGTKDAPASYIQQSTGQYSINPSLKLSSEGLTGLQSKLRATCHCGGVEFFVSRPNKASKACSSPMPDVLRPYHTYSSDNVGDIKWWIRGTERFLAATCACRSCRLAFASPITCWAFIPKTNLSNPDGTAFSLESGMLASYQSSKDTYRNFCMTCGTPVFWHNAGRPGLLDVSVGVFRAEEGARAETWLEWWTERVSFIEEAFEQDLVMTFASKLHSIQREHYSDEDSHNIVRG